MAELLLSAFLQVLFDRLASRDLVNFVRQLGGGVESELKNWENTLMMIRVVLGDAEEKLATGFTAGLIPAGTPTCVAFSSASSANSTPLLKLKTLERDLAPNCPESVCHTSRDELAPTIALNTSLLRVESSQLMTSSANSTNIWLDNLQDLAYDVEDILDEFATKALERKLKAEHLNASMPSRIKDIIGRLDRLCKQRNDLGLQLTPAVTSSSTAAARRPDSSSVPKERVVYGREDDKAKVLEMVLSDEPSVANVRVIPIVGIGGVGKTTLARKVYNDMAIIYYKFDLKAWVCVSDNFDVLSISKKLLPSITSKACDLNTLNEVQIKLKEAANGKKILIVLDDVWNVDYRLWETLKLRSLLLGILPVLRLSYHHLPSHLKRCFAYCALFPKDYEFKEKELVLLWKVEGLIRQPRNHKQLEEWGNKSFHDLVSRSIFQQSRADCLKFVMHDFVHDLAQFISGETIFRLEEAGDLSIRKERVRHSSYPRSDYDNKSRFQFLIGVEHLRTFLPVVISGGSYCGYISNMVVCDLLPRFKKLRVLSLEGYYVTRLPNSITKLRLLTYLNLSGTEIRCLPESTSLLLYLQILKLRDCLWLIKLPSRMRKLINLHHLDLRGAYKLDNMPLGMKELKNLQTLSNFIVGNSGSISRLNDLKDLIFLGGALCISGLENMENLQDAREAMLSKKQNLEELSLEWGFNNSRDEVVEGNVLDMLQPHRNPLFSKIEVLKLENCKNCISLPTLGLLGSLKDLTIKGMINLRTIGSEIYGDGCSTPFQSLEILYLENLPEWEC
ncbi:hypothetical protein CUMW_175580 [Citrus unshiu]|uniref:NB-ARC domain-containing protein n=1 Tax=Citrus unshiu TaxID=55188 RepID=A0A2H5PXW3_CITUN|nr:hypothetical protein CUMW_175580 [Citrus unshiu]